MIRTHSFASPRESFGISAFPINKLLWCPESIPWSGLLGPVPRRISWYSVPWSPWDMALDIWRTGSVVCWVQDASLLRRLGNSVAKLEEPWELPNCWWLVNAQGLWSRSRLANDPVSVCLLASGMLNGICKENMTRFTGVEHYRIIEFSAGHEIMIKSLQT